MREGGDRPVSLTVVSRPTELTDETLTRAGGATVPSDTTFDAVSVMFNDVQRSDAGVYTLTSSNTAGDGSVTFTLNVECKLQFKCTVHVCYPSAFFTTFIESLCSGTHISKLPSEM